MLFLTMLILMYLLISHISKSKSEFESEDPKSAEAAEHRMLLQRQKQYDALASKRHRELAEHEKQRLKRLASASRQAKLKDIEAKLLQLRKALSKQAIVCADSLWPDYSIVECIEVLRGQNPAELLWIEYQNHVYTTLKSHSLPMEKMLGELGSVSTEELLKILG